MKLLQPSTTLARWMTNYGPPVLVFLDALAAWEAYVRLNNVPSFILPAPSLVLQTLVADRNVLLPALAVTLGTTFAALLAAIAGGVGLAILFSQWRWVERSFLPFAIVLQVTPVIAIAPLLLIYLEAPQAVLVCAFLVAFFPILSNTALGLTSADHNLTDLFKLYQATHWQTLIHLRFPSALPYFLGGLRIGGGLALIGAIVAELAAGNAGKGAGLAFRIAEAGYRLNVPRMFAGLTLISLTGIAIFVVLDALSKALLNRWQMNEAAAAEP
ncbi:MAG: ABC transporter permease subunit [Alphaproteobacteria bacterium]|nr:ABC transporter permease subunit [Alphaproteobacteria bacterium]